MKVLLCIYSENTGNAFDCSKSCYDLLVCMYKTGLLMTQLIIYVN